jgi:tetratricopeptide (TPR) repeat protein
MGRDDWFRNSEWNPEVEAHFFAKLKRARDKAQYLRIQACSLAKTQPRVALMLLDRYFDTGDNFDRAQAYVDQAEAFSALGEIDKALASYERALAREKEFPNLLTPAYLEMPLLVATTGRHEKYERAMEILAQNRSRPMFPAERFKWHAASALICEASGDTDAARQYALAAINDAQTDHSGFRYHPTVGLVGSMHVDLRHHLTELAQGE